MSALCRNLDLARPRQSRWSNRPVCTVPSLQWHDLAPVELHSCVGSHLLVHNQNHAHAGPEACLVHTFRPSVAFLFKSGFDTNMGPFAYMPQLTLPYSTKQGYQFGSRHSQRLPNHTACAPSLHHNDVYPFRAVLRMLRGIYSVLKHSQSTSLVALEPTACKAWMGPSPRLA